MSGINRFVTLIFWKHVCVKNMCQIKKNFLQVYLKNDYFRENKKLLISLYKFEEKIKIQPLSFSAIFSSDNCETPKSFSVGMSLSSRYVSRNLTLFRSTLAALLIDRSESTRANELFLNSKSMSRFKPVWLSNDFSRALK